MQQPENTQNYNRYSYVLNNPLRYTDPSGEELISFTTAIIIGAVIAAATYTITAALADVPFSVGGLAKATFIGAASAAVTFGIGSGAENLFTNWVSCGWQQVARGAVQALAHGTFQGGMMAISGGKFWNGFAAGAASSIASSLFSADLNTRNDATLGWGNSVRSSGAGMIAFGTVSGGAGAHLSGGNFWQGAVTGLVVSGLNHFAHQMDNDDIMFDNDQEKGNEVTRKSLGIEKSDTRETMISKTLKGMKVGDYITGDEASFLGDAARKYIKTVTKTGSNTFKVEGKSSWGVSVFKDGATLTIKSEVIKTNLHSYKVTINGLTGTAKTFNVPSTSYISGNTARTKNNGIWYIVE